MLAANGSIAVFARWEDESKWDLIATMTELDGAIASIELDMKANIERTEQDGCPKRMHVLALVVGTSTAQPVADGKREVTVTRIES